MSKMITGQKAFMNGDTLAVDPKGAHICMTYKGRELLGEVKVVWKASSGYYYLNVFFFNGEPWPVEPAIWEVQVLVREYQEE